MYLVEVLNKKGQVLEINLLNSTELSSLYRKWKLFRKNLHYTINIY